MTHVCTPPPGHPSDRGSSGSAAWWRSRPPPRRRRPAFRRRRRGPQPAAAAVRWWRARAWPPPAPRRRPPARPPPVPLLRAGALPGQRRVQAHSRWLLLGCPPPRWGLQPERAAPPVGAAGPPRRAAPPARPAHQLAGQQARGPTKRQAPSSLISRPYWSLAHEGPLAGPKITPGLPQHRPCLASPCPLWYAHLAQSPSSALLLWPEPQGVIEETMLLQWFLSRTDRNWPLNRTGLPRTGAWIAGKGRRDRPCRWPS